MQPAWCAVNNKAQRKTKIALKTVKIVRPGFVVGADVATNGVR
jgi:hypothetical protein